MTRFTLYSWLIGFAGGFCLFYEQVPLAWLLGSMVATSIAAVSGLQVETYKPLTPWARCILGAMVGTGFDAVTVSEFLSYWTTLIIVPVFLVLATTVNFQVFRRVFGFDSFTSMFSALPGGMVEMVTSGRDMGADVKTLTIIHLMRVVIIVIGASVLGLYVGVQDLRMQTPSIHYAEYILMHLALGYVGWKIFAYFKVPSAPLLGPMFLVAGLQGFDVLHLKLFTPLLILAQVAIGIDIARAFCGVSIGSMKQAFFAGISSVLIMFVVLCFCALIVIFTAADIPWVQVILSFMPGGQTELALLAFALKLDLTFVVTHQIFRIALIMFSLPILLLSLRRLSPTDG
ncbi:AbrB family transcriptional regulator [Litoricolaceae bacterium]|nr:AbrB family transcriptional regulator [Litorivicinaceae bacterium]